MACTRNSVKRQKVATVESALFNPDVVFLLAALLDAQDLCQVSLTCKALGGRQASHDNGLSLVEDAAQRLFECASEWERACLPRYPDEGWVELYHHLLMLRSKLSFDQLAGNYIQHGEEESTIRTIPGQNWFSSALCSNHVMRSGKHFAVFTGLGRFGVVRPVQIKISDFREGELNMFSPAMNIFWEYLIGQRTARWTDSNVHCCCLNAGISYWCDWAGNQASMIIDGLQFNTPIGLLLDLDEGTLSIYQNGQRVATPIKDGLSGEYCWYATVCGGANPISIERGLAPGEQQAG